MLKKKTSSEINGFFRDYYIVFTHKLAGNNKFVGRYVKFDISQNISQQDSENITKGKIKTNDAKGII
jgi:hypothetical protein